MSDRSPGLISSGEYNSNTIFRLQQDDVGANQLYVAMFRLGPDPKYEAARLPLGVRGIISRQIGRFCASVAFFDLDLRTVIEAEATFNDRFWEKPHEYGIRLTHNTEFDNYPINITQGYLRQDDGSYEDNPRYAKLAYATDDRLVSV